jgi:hypothetical protein
MKDKLGRELQFGDLIVVAAGSYLDVGVLKDARSYHMHYYSLRECGVKRAAGVKGGFIGFINSPRENRILKITKESLCGEELKCYEEIMKIIQKDVATADNT